MSDSQTTGPAGTSTDATQKARPAPTAARGGPAVAREVPTEAAHEAARPAPVFLPPADVLETEQAVFLFLELPGASPESLDVTLDNRVLSIVARSTPFQPEGYALLYAEYETGNYERAFALSDDFDREKIEAVLRDGVLKLTLPKTTPSPARKIAVKPA